MDDEELSEESKVSGHVLFNNPITLNLITIKRQYVVFSFTKNDKT